MLLSWEEQEQRGLTVQTPAEGYKWNQLGALYQSFYQTYGQMSLESQLIALQDTFRKLLHWIDSLSEDELFLPQQRAWATTKAQWPLWKWIHINSVALLLVSERKFANGKKLVFKKLSTFFKKRQVFLNFPQKTLWMKFLIFPKNFSTMLICSTLNLCNSRKKMKTLF